MKRKLYKGGKYSFVVSIPKEIVKQLKWKSGQFLEVLKKGRTLSLKDARSKK